MMPKHKRKQEYQIAEMTPSGLPISSTALMVSYSSTGSREAIDRVNRLNSQAKGPNRYIILLP
jgi:hypothetical protein